MTQRNKRVKKGDEEKTANLFDLLLQPNHPANTRSMDQPSLTTKVEGPPPTENPPLEMTFPQEAEIPFVQEAEVPSPQELPKDPQPLELTFPHETEVQFPQELDSHKQESERQEHESQEPDKQEPDRLDDPGKQSDPQEEMGEPRRDSSKPHPKGQEFHPLDDGEVLEGLSKMRVKFLKSLRKELLKGQSEKGPGMTLQEACDYLKSSPDATVTGVLPEGLFCLDLDDLGPYKMGKFRRCEILTSTPRGGLHIILKETLRKRFPATGTLVTGINSRENSELL
uniref:Uncharacterized protein n=1 Tax=Nephroselmis olivacea TaxID=31312 RepID=Q9T4G2_NEPOL|nr:hypothetical protein NeolCp091 [Nephroselmis olivacea]NP_050951.1 hypothetical protein NeolCp146 [Nephroselmis olivacea]AAD54867.1 unknown [Nephroselmis olivacea]AAD54922.1 unknown [Nephroselmis olivacea]